ncbi:MAG TPA: LuxR C-terminal-related transcriptional regulator, partial [Pyrinomonadaceae bacterium]|nr:LuxR C-terminal-related transcriptional regulator [Pyrinomonadaceae bacterium]
QIASRPFGWRDEPSKAEQAMALLALSHTPLEHQLYRAMLSEVTVTRTRVGAFSARTLMMLTGLNSLSAIRRGRAGLLKKLSIERYNVAGEGHLQPQQQIVYFVFSPHEIFTRRQAAGLEPYPKEVQAHETSEAFGQVVERVLGRHNLSRRQAQVALCCAKGLTNAEIGEKLSISDKTVKFHLRHIFIKFGVRRRAELISRLLI